jgi:hypothetical protein
MALAGRRLPRSSSRSLDVARCGAAAGRRVACDGGVWVSTVMVDRRCVVASAVPDVGVFPALAAALTRLEPRKPMPTGDVLSNHAGHHESDKGAASMRNTTVHAYRKNSTSGNTNDRTQQACARMHKQGLAN